MQYIIYRPPLLARVARAVACASILLLAAAVTPQAQSLFTPVEARALAASQERVIGAAARSEAEREGALIVTLDPSALNSPFDVQLASQKRYTLTPTKTREWNDHTVYQAFDEQTGAYSILTLSRGQWMGRIVTPDGIVTLHTLGNGLYALVPRFGENDLPDDAVGEQSSDPKEGPKVETADPSSLGPVTGVFPNDDGSALRVLVGYTPEAAAQASTYGWTIEGVILTGISEGNIAHQQSNSQTSFELAGIVAVSTSQGNFARRMSDDLSRLRLHDGAYDDVFYPREVYAADIIKLVVDRTKYLNEPAPVNSQICGIAYISSSSSRGGTPSANYGVAISDGLCTMVQMTFVHEIGHLYGALHQRACDGSNSPFRYGHGYVPSGAPFRTVMATSSPGCGTSATRLPYWSNPSVVDPASGSVTGEATYSDNARVLRNRRGVLANFRKSRFISQNVRVGLNESSDTYGPVDIELAGGGTYFEVAGNGVSGGYVVFRPGGKVVMKPGTHIEAGGYFAVHPQEPNLGTSLTETYEGPIVAAKSGGGAIAAEFVGGSQVLSVPDVLTVRGAWPNPSTRSTTVEFGLPTQTDVRVHVYDMLGREVVAVEPGPRDAGWHEVLLDVSGLTPGAYVCRVVAGGEARSHQIVVAR